MASSYTNDLRLNEMATGDASGTWGDTTNTNLELIAEAFSYGTEAITTNADTHTTTIADGATDPGRSMFLKYTGTLDSTCTITIGPNTVSKLWIIENGTSGSQSIIIKQGSGATVTIPSGKTKVIYSDGAGSGGAMVDAFASLNLQTSGIIETSASIQTALIEYTDGDDAMTIADGGQVTFSQNIIGTLATAAQPNITSLGTLTTLTVDDITINGSTISDGGDLTVDVGGTIDLDSDGGQIKLSDAGTQIGLIQMDSGQNLIFRSMVSDKDMSFKGNDGGSTITALTLDMSDAGSATFNSNVIIPQKLIHSGDTDTYLEFNTNQIDLIVGDVATFKSSASAVIINEASADVDFRVESNGNANMLFVDGGNNQVGIGTNSVPSLRTFQVSSSDIVPIEATSSGGETIISIDNTATNGRSYFLISGGSSGTYAGGKFGIFDADAAADRMSIDSSGNVTFNEGSLDSDFRVESDNNTHALFVDAGNNRIGINDDSPISLLGLKGTANTDDCKIYMREDANNGAFIKYDGATNKGELGGLTSGSENTVMTWNRAADEVVFNEESIDMDFRVESNAKDHALFLQGSSSKVGINQASPAAMIDIVTVDTAGADALRIRQPDSSDIFQIQAGISGATNDGLFLNNTNTTGQLQGWKNFEINFNDDGVDRDFRVESNGNTHMLFVDGGNDAVGIGTSSPASLIHGMSGDLFLTANSTSANSGQGLYFQSTTSGWNTSSAHAAIFGKRVDASNGYLRFDTRSSGTTAERMRIDSAGAMQIGGTTNAGFIDFDSTKLQLNTQRNPNTGTFVNTSRSHASIELNGSDGGSLIVFRTAASNNTVASTRMEIQQDGKIAIGNNIPIWSGSYGGGLFLKGNNATADRYAQLCIVDSNGDAAQTGLVINNNGSATFGGDILPGADVIMANGRGISFAATSDASGMTSELLDDYEEGTWTPVLGPGSSQAYGNRSGHYTKVGRMVTAYFGARLTAGTFTSAEATISGLPFAVHSTGSYQEPQFNIYTLGEAPTGQTNGLNNGAYLPGQVSFYLNGGESQGRGRKYSTNADSVLDANEVFDSNTFIKGIVTYYTS